MMPRVARIQNTAAQVVGISVEAGSARCRPAAHAVRVLTVVSAGKSAYDVRAVDAERGTAGRPRRIAGLLVGRQLAVRREYDAEHLHRLLIEDEQLCQLPSQLTVLQADLHAAVTT